MAVAAVTAEGVAARLREALQAADVVSSPGCRRIAARRCMKKNNPDGPPPFAVHCTKLQAVVDTSGG
jgi:hypothetical protein